jgi:hypothetical protein
MDETSEDKIKKAEIKKKVKEKLQDQIDKIETQTGKPLPKDFVKLFDEAIEVMTPTSEAEAFVFLKKFPEDLKDYLQTFKNESTGLDPNCKDFFDKMIKDLMLLTNGKGIENGIWNHFKKIWYYFQVVNQMDTSAISEKSLSKDLFQLSFLYVSLYELTLQILTEYALVIASRRKNFRHAKIFLNRHLHEVSRGRTVGKQELVNFFKKQHYMSNKSCGILENAKFRHKPAHADAYFDEDTRKMVIGTETFDIQEIIELWKDLKRFYCYLVYVNLNQPSMQNMIAQLEEIAKKIPETPEIKADVNQTNPPQEENSSI